VITTGTQLGPYEIAAPLGAGGMGQVYRATDTRLGRAVAIKVLPAEFSKSTQLRTRFEREAKAISSLTHPNICTLYDIGRHDGFEYLVMELIEGETLADRLQRGALPVAEAVGRAMEIADALDRAHRSGIVHRDLKPGNVMLAKGGGTKLLDFGLAKPILDLGDPDGDTLVGAPLTAEGAIVGTLHYMAPEQIEGGVADARTDIWSLGAVLYEMLTGRRAFDAKSRASMIVHILEHDPPPMNELQPLAPPALERVVRTCLAKNPDDRFQSAHDVVLALRLLSGESAMPLLTRTTRRPPRRREWLAWSVAAVAIVAAIALAFRGFAPARESHLVASILPPPHTSFLFTGDYAGPAVLSPNGKLVAFVAAADDGSRALWLRALDDPQPRRLEGTQDAMWPFWSPDSRSLGFFSGGKLRTIDADGGPVTALADAGEPRGGAWSEDGAIVFEPATRSGLMRVPATGGRAQTLVEPDLKQWTTYRWPYFLPGGKVLLYLAANHAGGAADTALYATTPDGKRNVRVAEHVSNAAFADGKLFYVRDNVLVSQAFDPKTLAVSDKPSVVAPAIRFDASIWRAVFDVSRDGTLLYQSGGADGGTEVEVLDPNGHRLADLGARDRYYEVAFSPDGKRIAYNAGDPQASIWLLELERGSRTRLTFEDTIDAAPVWSRDGSMIYYASASRDAPLFAVYRKRAGGDAPREPVLRMPHDAFPDDVSPDGAWLLVSTGPKATMQSAVLAVSTRDPSKQVLLSPSSPTALDSRFSPDGRWVLMTAFSNNRAEVVVIPFPMRAGQWQISAAGGRCARWLDGGRRIRYVAIDGTVIDVEVDGSGESFKVGPSTRRFHVETNNTVQHPLDATQDGRMVVNRGEQSDATPLTLVTSR
jgi:eukaryotic-like serine/threonine-protein kinase